MSTLVSTLNKLVQLPLTQRRMRLSPEALERVQLSRLSETLQRAYRQVPLYRERFDKARVQPRDLRSLEDLDRCRIQQTSGSSGQCMEIAIDPWTDDQRTLFTQRVYGLVGFTFWKRMAYLFPYPLPLQKNLGLYRNRHISTQLPASEILAQLRKFEPHLLAATPSDLFDLFDAVPDDSSALSELALERICVHSEPLSADERAHIESRFGCPVSTNYYCNEVWAIAAECTSGALHQFPDNVVVEIVDDHGIRVRPGQVGHVLVTSLRNHAQPFIRYRLGDLAAWDTRSDVCECGLVLPRLRMVEGRDDDYVDLPSGQRIHPSKLTVAVKQPCFAYPGAQVYRDYRITQHAPDRVSVQIVPGRDRDRLSECSEKSLQNIRAVLGSSITADLRVVTSLDRGSGGKRKIVERLPWE